MLEFRDRMTEFFIVFSMLSVSLVHGFTVEKCNCNCPSREHVSRNVCDIIAEMMSKNSSDDVSFQRYATDTSKMSSLFQKFDSNGEENIKSAVIPSKDSGIWEGGEKNLEKSFAENIFKEALTNFKKRTNDLEKDLASKMQRMESELLLKIQETLDQAMKVKDEILVPVQEAEEKSRNQTEELLAKVQGAENRCLEMKEDLLEKIKNSENRSSEVKEELIVRIQGAEIRSLEMKEDLLEKLQGAENRSLEMEKELLEEMKDAEMRSAKSNDVVLRKIEAVENHFVKMDINILNQMQQAHEKATGVLQNLIEVEKEFKDGLATEVLERRDLEEKVNETQTMVRSILASRMEARKNISSAIENLAAYINNTVKEEKSAIDYKIESFNTSLYYQLESIKTEVKGCAKYSFLVKLEEELGILENNTTEFKTLSSRMLPRVQEMEEKVAVLLENRPVTNMILQNHSSEISEIKHRVHSVEFHQLSETPEKICPSTTTGWVDVGKDLCYLFFIESNLNWYEANFDCQTKGGVLASIHSEAETDLLRPYLGGKRKHLFIGLHRSLSNNDRFEWIDGSEVNYSNWRTNQPDNYRQKEACGELTASSMKWNDIHCDGTRGYICSTRKIPKIPSTLCPSTEWVEGSGQWCYFFETASHRTWDDANYDCLRRGGALLIIHSEEERVNVHDLVSVTGSFWIGLRRNLTNSDRFVWVDGEERSYTYWEENEPNRYEGNEENCVETREPSKEWNDNSCHYKRAYICSSRKAKPF